MSAVVLGALVGPAQVGARLRDGFRRPASFDLDTDGGGGADRRGALVLLWSGVRPLAIALIAYGAGNGIWSIARGTLPLALFGPRGYAALMGRLAMPSLIAQQMVPLIGAVLILRFGAGTTLGALALLAAANVVGVAALWLLARPRMTEAFTTSS